MQSLIQVLCCVCVFLREENFPSILSYYQKENYIYFLVFMPIILVYYYTTNYKTRSSNSDGGDPSLFMINGNGFNGNGFNISLFEMIFVVRYGDNLI